jgi:hypothetical protein
MWRAEFLVTIIFLFLNKNMKEINAFFNSYLIRIIILTGNYYTLIKGDSCRNLLYRLVIATAPTFTAIPR